MYVYIHKLHFKSNHSIYKFYDLPSHNRYYNVFSFAFSLIGLILLKTADLYCVRPHSWAWWPPLSSARAEKVRSSAEAAGPEAGRSGQPQVKKGQLTNTFCSQYPAVSNTCFITVITETSLFSFRFQLPGHTEILDNVITWAFPPGLQWDLTSFTSNSTCGTNLNTHEARPANSWRAGGEGLLLSFGHYAGFIVQFKFGWPDKDKRYKKT